MDAAGPRGRQASAAELFAALAAAAPDQRAVWAAVAELAPRLLSATAHGPLRGFAVDLETTGRQWAEHRVIDVGVMDLATGACVGWAGGWAGGWVRGG